MCTKISETKIGNSIEMMVKSDPARLEVTPNYIISSILKFFHEISKLHPFSRYQSLNKKRRSNGRYKSHLEIIGDCVISVDSFLPESVCFHKW